MKVGLIARAEDRGLGIQTWEWFRHMNPDRTLLVDLGPLARAHPRHDERYPGATKAALIDGQLDETLCRDWLDGLDIVYSAETYYDWRFITWADQAHVATVCHANPEFYRHPIEHWPHPAAWWAPTHWRLAHLAPGTRVVPVPVPLDRFPNPLAASGERDQRIRWLHVIGHRAAMDRNGTTIVLQALRRVRRPHLVRMMTQDIRMPQISSQKNVELQLRTGNVPDYWHVYDDADALLLPRRYGGLCLPALEGQAAGLAVIMSDASPQRATWPVTLTRTADGRSFVAPCGRVELRDAEPAGLARLMDDWYDDPALVRAQQARGRAWAEANSWQHLRPTIVAELAAVL